MSAPKRPTGAQIRRRRRVAAGVLVLFLGVIAYVAFLAPESEQEQAEQRGFTVTHLEIDSKAVGEELGVNVIVPPRAGARGERSLLLYLHGRGGYEGTFNDAVLRGLPRLHGRGPVVAFPAGGDHGYWHNRAEGDWETYVMDEVVPTVVRRFGVDPERLAIGGISMGGFGAYSIALNNPGRFCAVGGHSPALWFDGGETAPGAFDDAADFERNDVVGTVQADPDAFGDARVWIDYGDEDPFRPYDEGFVEAMNAGGTDFTAHEWPGAHEGGYWDSHWPAYQRFYVDSLADC
ncbi:MAG TPA: alpha/beta hydrolase-fold protein [Solirubrobacterales bacterium]|nr:alpha/beta hydrolase-fold protein [Solirubrobacterales bacterium]